ncbi:MAG: hypothetical protein K2L02_03555, partial [Clostridia bacterium]|nr:hypothetical protein [Clostridia bacterium]
HSGTHHEAVAESCTTDGNVEYWECENGCEKNYSDATYTTELEGSPVIAAHHTFDAVTWGAWTEKTEGGWTCTYSATCSVCGDTQSETGATVTSKETPATCIATGVRTYTAKAGNVTNPTEKTEEIAMLAHNGVKHEAAEPTCTEAGNNEYWSCDKGCDNVWSNATLETTTTLEAVTIAATGHDYDLENIEWTWTDTTAATAKVTCKTDNTHIDEITATITSAVTKQATETEEGETTYTATITVGDETYTTTKTAPIAKLTGNTAGGDDDGEKSGGCGSSIGGTVGMIAGLSVCLGAACATIFLRKKKIQK